MRRSFSPSRKYGMWTVERPAGRNASGSLVWGCRCECGTERVVLQQTLLSGTSTCCGCTTRFKHGHNGRVRHGNTIGGYTAEYRAWLHLRGRCYNPNVKKFENHGGRGITVCDRWRDSFENFLADMGPRPSAKHSIDRIDNDGPYSPENCRWATARVQQGNKRNSVLVTVSGVTMALRQACDEYGVDYRLVHLRIRRGWSLEDAVAKPRGRQNGATCCLPASSKWTERDLRIAFAGRACQTYRHLQQARAA